MFGNYLKVALRNLQRGKTFAAINIAGLTLGATSCLLIVLYVVDELGYDRYNSNAPNIYRANGEVKYGNNMIATAAQPGAFAPYVRKSFPEVREAVRLVPAYDHPAGFRIREGRNILQEKSIIYADSGLFRVFSFPLVAGDTARALRDANTAVITERAAKKYFGRTDVVGQTFVLDDSLNFTVTGVMRDIPRQSHFIYDIFLSMASLPDSRDPGWGGGGYNSYLLLAPGADIHRLEKAFSKLCTYNNRDWLIGKNDYFKVVLMPVTDIHLRSNLRQELGQNGNIQYVYVFSVIALIILLIAGVNFMNLSTARSAGRAKEVGIRKVLGSPRRSLIGQFLTESVLVTFASTILSVILAILLLPLLNNISGKELVFNGQVIRWLLPSSVALVAIFGLAAGVYPAFFLSSFQPAVVLKSKLSTGFKGGGLRNALVVVQFSIAVFLIAGTLVIYKQLHFIQTKNLGYSRDQVLIVKNTDALRSAAPSFKQKILRLPGVSSASFTAFVPTAQALSEAGLYPDISVNNNQAMITEFWPVDADYVRTLGMQIIAGRNFSSGMPTDSSAIVINEAAVKFLGFKDPVNATVYQSYPKLVAWHIIGVVKDFNFKSLRENITPAAFYLHADYGALNIKVNTGNIVTIMTEIKEAWKSVAPGISFDYGFMDADFDAAYRVENRVGIIFMIFTVMAIGIACLGLFGLSAYAAAQRTREIGIRKVLGAGIPALVRLLCLDFIKPVALAFAVAAPVAFLSMQRWLAGFVFRTTISWWVIPAAGLAALIIALVTIGFQSINAALANPVDSLKED
jgi:putative ABC transport system permease protein